MERRLGVPRPSHEEVFQKNDFHCVYCGFDGSSFEGWKFLQVDHFKPRSKGGTDDLQNLVTSCMICNFMKGANEWTTLEKAKREIRCANTGRGKSSLYSPRLKEDYKM